MRFVIFSQGNAVTDGTWSSTDLMSWSVAEPDIYLISACLPTLRPILSRIWGRNGSTTNSSHRYGKSFGGTVGTNANYKPNSGAQTQQSDNYCDSALYGDEVQLVSIVGKEANTNRVEVRDQDRIYVEREVNVVVQEN